MIRYLFAIIAAAALTGGFSSTLSAQEAPDSAGERATETAPRLTPEQRRAQWQEMRNGSAEERRARLEELREARRAASVEDGQAEADSYLGRLEFRSIVSIGGVTEFTLHDPETNRSLVVSTEEGTNGIEFVEFNAETNALTVSHEGETRTLHLRSARVDALERDRGDDRRERWEERREQFRAFRERWERAAENSPELREIEQQFEELGGAFRENWEALRNAEDGTPEHRQLVERQRAMREEFRLLSQYSLMEVERNPAFEEQDAEVVRGMMRGMMRGRDGGRGDRNRNWSRGND